ncbi:AraC family transcriptional regulator [Lapidilactobacillus bayanensis]|uniref:AraC family transcriptional regulator n=1 Tax=Lapidilactobacillus bayanensis TaxID=2485998 RepID=UPI000F7B5A0D|nr:AraC family transcriptional regulator [Lapidilactobacillus bayanensis]
MQDLSNVDTVLLDDDFYIDHKITTDHKMDRPHFHDGYEIHFTLCNNTRYYIDDKKFICNQGSVAVINSQEIHRVVVDPKISYERYFILFKPGFLEFAIVDYPELLRIFNQRPNDFVNCIQFSLDDQTNFSKLLNQLYVISRHKMEDTLYGLKVRQKFIELLIFLTEHFSRDQSIGIKRDYSQNELLTRIVHYVRENIGEDLSLEVISRQFYISKSTIIRIFKFYMGMTPLEFITYTRIMRARALILKGYSIREVAFRVGYKDESGFIKKFKALQGSSPKQYWLKKKKLD